MPDDRSYAQKQQDRRMERSLVDSAAHAKMTSKSVATMLKLSEAQIRLAQSARQDAEKAERFAKWTVFASLGIALASLAISLVGLFGS